MTQTEELFAAGYELWSGPLYAYVSKRVAGRQVRERIVREVLARNLDLLVGRREEMSEASRLMTSADRLIADTGTTDLFLARWRLERSSRQRPLTTEREGKVDRAAGNLEEKGGSVVGTLRKELER